MFSHPRAATSTAVVSILAIQCVLLAGSARQKSPTIDEPHHLTIGVMTLASGDFRMCRDDPPLQNLSNAAPVLLLGEPYLPFQAESWIEGRNYGALAHSFVEANRDRILGYVWLARLVSVGISLMTSCLVFVWARSLFGRLPGLACLVVAAFEPTLLAHGRLITTDALAALLFTGTCYAAWRLARRPTIPRTVFLTALLGGALATKHSSLLLIPFALLLAAVAHAGNELRIWPPRPGHIRAIATALIVIFLGSGLVLWAIFGFEIGDSVEVDRPPILDPVWSSLYQVGETLCGTIGLRAPFGSPNDPREWTWVAMRRWLPLFSYWESLFTQAAHARRGHWANFLGEVGTRGWWSYYPVLFAAKTTIPFLFLVLIGTVILFRDSRYSWIDRIILVGPPLFFILLLVFVNRSAIGIRHLVPVYPLFCILPGAFARRVLQSTRRRTRVWLFALIALLVGHSLETVRTYPHFLTYYNQFVGGPPGGFSIATDSNLDWGQDLPLLAREAKRRNIDHLHLIYFGSLDFPSLYGLEWHDPDYTELGRPGWWAISATCLSGIGSRFTFDDLALFRQMKPVAVLGHSIFLYRIPSI